MVATTTTTTSLVEQEPLVGCEDCNNQSDPVTLEDFRELPPQYLFKVHDANVTHCFDIRSLHEYYEKTGKLENPLTRAVFSKEALDAFLARVVQLGLTPSQDAKRMADERTEQEQERERIRELEDIRAALGDEYHPELDALISGRLRHHHHHHHHRHGLRNQRQRGRRRYRRGGEDEEQQLGALSDNPIARAMARYQLDGANDLLRRMGVSLPIGRPRVERTPLLNSRTNEPPSTEKPRPTSQQQFRDTARRYEDVLAASRPGGRSENMAAAAAVERESVQWENVWSTPPPATVRGPLPQQQQPPFVYHETDPHVYIQEIPMQQQQQQQYDDHPVSPTTNSRQHEPIVIENVRVSQPQVHQDTRASVRETHTTAVPSWWLLVGLLLAVGALIWWFFRY